MDETRCESCGANISRRAKANIWNGQSVVCTACLKQLEAAERRNQAAIKLAGKPGAAWLVFDGARQIGPYSTDQLIAELQAGRVDWMWDIWRDGMPAWSKAARLFMIPWLDGGRIELRDFGQGDELIDFT